MISQLNDDKDDDDDERQCRAEAEIWVVLAQLRVVEKCGLSNSIQTVKEMNLGTKMIE